MAVLGKIRQRSALIIVVIGLAMFAFLLPELLQNGFNIDSNNVGTINGKDIRIEEFRFKVDNLEKSGQGVTGIQAVNRVWEQEINVALINEEFDKMGIRVNESHILNVLKNDPNFGQNPMFQNEAGQFDINKVREFFRSNPEQKFFLESREADAELNAKYQIYSTMLRSGFFATLSDAKFKNELQNKKVDFDFVSLPYSSINDSEVAVSDAEILDYMKKYPKKYKAEETREIEFVLVDERATAEYIAEINSKLTALLKDRARFNAETKTTDTVPGFSRTRDVVEFVNSNSEIPYDSSFIAKSDLPAAFADALFELPENQVYGPYQDGEFMKITRSLGKQSGAKARASHILISYDGTSVPNQKEFRTKEEAKAKAEQLLAQVNKNKDEFGILAIQNSDDSSAQRAGDLGFFNPGMMVQPFNDFVFNNPVGKIGLVETDFGFHIVNITDKEDAIRLATIALKIVPSEETMNAANEKALNIENDATKLPLADVANKYGLEVQKSERLGAFDENLGALGAQRPIVRWAFDKKTDIDDVKLFEVVDQGYVIARLKKVNEKGLLPIEDARLAVEPILKNRKKAAILTEKINKGSIEEVAKANNVAVNQATDVSIENAIITGAGFEPRVVGVAIGQGVNAVSNAVEGVSGVYRIRTKTIKEAMPQTDYTALINTLKSTGASSTSKLFTVLKDNAKIKDNRAKFNY